MYQASGWDRTGAALLMRYVVCTITRLEDAHDSACLVSGNKLRYLNDGFLNKIRVHKINPRTQSSPQAIRCPTRRLECFQAIQ
jgi:hypothetical protein